MQKNRLVFFHFFEKNENYLNNFIHFLTFGLDDECDYVIAISGSCSLILPQIDNVEYFYVNNFNGDFGGYCQVIPKIKRLFGYQYYFFINCSVRGPFLSPSTSDQWWAVFEKKFQGNIGLIGTAINFLPLDNSQSKAYYADYSGGSTIHVQTTAYAMRHEVFKYLVDQGFYQEDKILNKGSLISRYEINLSQKIIDGGWGVGCILPELDAIFKGDNFDGKLNPTSRNGDLQFRQAYFGRSAHPYEILFVKTERNLFPIEYLNRLAFSMLTSRLRDSISGIFQSSYLNTLTGVGKSSLRVPIEVCVFKFRDLINCLLFKYKFKK